MFQFTGNVGKDAEVKKVGDKSVIEYSVAVYAGKDKDQNNQTMWINCAKWLYGNSDPNPLDMPKKGDLVFVNCRPNMPRVYTTNAGAQGVSFDVVVNNLEILKKAGDSNYAQSQQSWSSQPQTARPMSGQAPPAPPAISQSNSTDEDDLPF